VQCCLLDPKLIHFNRTLVTDGQTYGHSIHCTSTASCGKMWHFARVVDDTKCIVVTHVCVSTQMHVTTIHFASSTTCATCHILPHDAVLVQCMLWPYVCPSVTSVLSKWLNLWSSKQHYTTARNLLSVCLSTAACLHYCMDPDVTWGNGRGCP